MRICVFPGKQQECLCQLSYRSLPTKPGWKAAGIWGASGRSVVSSSRTPPAERRGQAPPGALVSEEPVLRGPGVIGVGGWHWGRRPPGAVPGKGDPEGARGASLLREALQSPRGWGCGWRRVLGLWVRCWDLGIYWGGGIKTGILGGGWCFPVSSFRRAS